MTNSPASHKTRILSLRISEKDFDALKSRYAAHGARSISEFARDAMQNMIAGHAAPSAALELRIQEIDGRLSLLDSEVSRLSQVLETALAARK